jgi:lipoprotein-anchoring transpeptidase ErfK/SrfK
MNVNLKAPVVVAVCFRLIACGLLALTLCNCSSTRKDRDHVLRISVPEQKLALYQKGVRIREYPVSTSKFGLGDRPNSNRTPLGKMEVAQKIGGGAPAGAVFKDRRWTGEIIRPDSPGRDPIVSRILWLRGTETWNRGAFSRYIYIHGTAEERNVGRPVSYGCVRMRSRDIIALYEIVGAGADVYILNLPLPPADQEIEKNSHWNR